MYDHKKNNSAEGGGCAVISLVVFLLCTGLWLNHIFTCFATEAWGFLVAGAVLFPIGILHGVYLLFV